MMIEPLDGGAMYRKADEIAQKEYQDQGLVDVPTELGIEPITDRAFRNGDIFFVRSDSTAGKWYKVEHGHCGCPGYYYRHSCNHMTHLEKKGYLVHDTENGHWKIPVEKRATVEQAMQVTTGIRGSLRPDEQLAKREEQLRRVQVFAQKEFNVIQQQRRLISALRLGDDLAVARQTRLVSIAQRAMDDSTNGLSIGDLVEMGE